MAAPAKHWTPVAGWPRLASANDSPGYRALVVTFASRGETPPEVRRAVLRAIERWEECLGVPGMFEVDESTEWADVVVAYSRRIQFEGKDVAGLVRLRTEYARVTTGGWEERRLAQIELATHAPNGLPQREEAMLQAAMHELGHVLGLRHDGRGRGVMGALDLRRPITEPSMDEIRALATVYGQHDGASGPKRRDDPYALDIQRRSQVQLDASEKRTLGPTTRRTHKQDTRPLDACM